MSETKEILSEKSAYRKFPMLVRVVKDREIGTFSHDLESLRENAFAEVTLKNCGVVYLISKARNYSKTPYDIMVCLSDEHKSSLHDLSRESRREISDFLSYVSTEIADISGLQVAIAVNQHPGGFSVLERDNDGSKSRVQTIKPVHFHIYEFSGPHDTKVIVGNLSKYEQRDISDPFLALTTDIAIGVLSKFAKNLPASAIEITKSLSRPPFGVNMKISDGKKLSNEVVDILSRLEVALMKEYERVGLIFRDNAIVNTRKTHGEGNNALDTYLSERKTLSRYSARILKFLAGRIQMNSENSDTSYKFLNGLGLTFTIIRQGEGFVINIHPRVMSTGNSADSMGIYIDNKEGEDLDELKRKKDFYKDFIDRLSGKYDVNEGRFLKK